jgi:hypothetical protein
MNEAHGIKVDVDFQVMVEQNMNQVQPMRPVTSSIITQRIAHSS